MIRKNLILTLAVLTSIAIFGMNSCGKDKKVKLKSAKDTISWVLGENMARGFKETGIDIDNDVLLAAMERCLDGKEGMLDDSTYYRVLNDINMMIFVNQRQKAEEAAAKAQEAEAEYFKQLKANDPDVRVTESGLHYKVLKQGKGKKSFMGGRVRFHYKASYADGTVFDQTYGVRGPVVTVLNNVFPGLQEGLKMMNGGSHYILYIPNALAFGAEGTTDVPPYTLLVYEIELFDVMD
ncbi:MAG: FKBP-type peptidyl-prolyl cis-trans isomerase [Bacteroidales bacterium]|nr:FKBP-type peptidyl-prolyl cis-trans isomerase [Bacteroidales bacterium]